MVSWRLWRQVSQPDIKNPIVRRFGSAPKPAPVSGRKSRLRRFLWAVAALGLIVILLNPAQIFVLLFVLPMLLITLAVAAPLLLPLVTYFAGAALVGDVISAIAREKLQHTYELMCVCPEGALFVNWSCATGVLHRGGWLSALRWGTSASLRLGLVALGGLMVLGLGLLASDHQQVGAEQARIILVYTALLVLYGAQLSQSLPLGLIIGLFASSFDWHKRDALFIGALLYLFCQALPLLLALLVYATGSRLAADAHPLLPTGMEVGALLLIALARELVVVLLWAALRRRLNSNQRHSYFRFTDSP